MTTRAGMFATEKLTSLINENDQLIAIFVKSIKTARSVTRKPT
jgi:hypothetical protein